jgi:hypothetical protein
MGNYPAGTVRRRAARSRDLSLLRPMFMQTTNRKVKTKSLMNELRKNIQLGVALY